MCFILDLVGLRKLCFFHYEGYAFSTFALLFKLSACFSGNCHLIEEMLNIKMVGFHHYEGKENDNQ